MPHGNKTVTLITDKSDPDKQPECWSTLTMAAKKLDMPYLILYAAITKHGVWENEKFKVQRLTIKREKPADGAGL